MNFYYYYIKNKCYQEYVKLFWGPSFLSSSAKHLPSLFQSDTITPLKSIFLNVHQFSTYCCQLTRQLYVNLGFPEDKNSTTKSQNWVSCLKLLLLLLLSHLSRVRLCATPQTAAHQALPSLRFSRQEHWSGLPFPSPVHESEKWKWSRSVLSDS